MQITMDEDQRNEYFNFIKNLCSKVDNRDYIYSIRVFEEIAPLTDEGDSWRNWSKCLQNSMHAGWFNTEEIALEAVKNNWSDVNEACYTYALVEKVGWGMYGHALKRWLFKFNYETREYEEIEVTGHLKELSEYGCWTMR